jgi:hypothetical protein
MLVGSSNMEKRNLNSMKRAFVALAFFSTTTSQSDGDFD